MTDKIELLYDKDCPICNQYVCGLSNSEKISTLNARDEHERVQAVSDAGFNIDDGAAVFYQGKTWYGADAVSLVANHVSVGGLVGLVNRIFFRNIYIAKMTYPVFVAVRKSILLIKNIPLINEKDTHVVDVYFNSACPVCRTGIGYQKDRMNHCSINWNDVHDDNELVEELDEELEFVRERLHIINSLGEKRVGIDAFIDIWADSPKDKWKAKFLRLPFIYSLGKLSYNIFAKFLYRINRLFGNW